MRVLIYSPAFLPSIGGLELVVASLAEELVRLGDEVTVVTTTEAWLDKVPSHDVRALYVALSTALGSAGQWRPGGATGSQLVLELDVPGVAKALHLVRLKENRASLVFFGWLQKQGLTAVEGWAREQARNLGVDDGAAPQPSLGDTALAQLAAVEFAPLLAFVSELRARIEDEA